MYTGLLKFSYGEQSVYQPLHRAVTLLRTPVGGMCSQGTQISGTLRCVAASPVAECQVSTIGVLRRTIQHTGNTLVILWAAAPTGTNCFWSFFCLFFWLTTFAFHFTAIGLVKHIGCWWNTGCPKMWSVKWSAQPMLHWGMFSASAYWTHTGHVIKVHNHEYVI